MHRPMLSYQRHWWGHGGGHDQLVCVFSLDAWNKLWYFANEQLCNNSSHCLGIVLHVPLLIFLIKQEYELTSQRIQHHVESVVCIVDEPEIHHCDQVLEAHRHEIVHLGIVV